MRRIERDACYYLDHQNDDTERIRQLFQSAEIRRDRRNRAYKLTAFWFAVFAVVITLVMAKLWTMGAIAGIK